MHSQLVAGIPRRPGGRFGRFPSGHHQAGLYLDFAS